MATRPIPQGSLLPPWARVRDIARKVPGLVRPSDYYLLLVMQVGSDEITKSQGHQKGLQGTGAMGCAIRGTSSVLLSPISGREEH